MGLVGVSESSRDGEGERWSWKIDKESREIWRDLRKDWANQSEWTKGKVRDGVLRYWRSSERFFRALDK